MFGIFGGVPQRATFSNHCWDTGYLSHDVTYSPSFWYTISASKVFEGVSGQLHVAGVTTPVSRLQIQQKHGWEINFSQIPKSQATKSPKPIKKVSTNNILINLQATKTIKQLSHQNLSKRLQKSPDSLPWKKKLAFCRRASALTPEVHWCIRDLGRKVLRPRTAACSLPTLQGTNMSHPGKGKSSSTLTFDGICYFPGGVTFRARIQSFRDQWNLKHCGSLMHHGVTVEDWLHGAFSCQASV